METKRQRIHSAPQNRTRATNQSKTIRKQKDTTPCTHAEAVASGNNKTSNKAHNKEDA